MSVITEQQSHATYDIGIDFYEKRTTHFDAVSVLVEKYKMNKASAAMYIGGLRHMLLGWTYQRELNAYTTDYYLTRIAKERSQLDRRNAIRALAQHIKYIESNGNIRNKLRGVLKKHTVGNIDTSPTSEQIINDFESAVAISLNLDTTSRRKLLENYSTKPAEISVLTRQFARNPHVAAETLDRANGICENCKKPAPFRKKSMQPYLEVHHKVPLSEHGDDTVQNTAALCPNCHREAHFGENWKRFRD